MKVLADTSVWIAHLRSADQQLLRLVEEDNLVCHPYVITELACGSLPEREALLDVLSGLETLPVASQEELRHFIGERCLYARGCGLVDLALLASVVMTSGIALWTLDKRLYGGAPERPRAGCRLHQHRRGLRLAVRRQAQRLRLADAKSRAAARVPGGTAAR